ncbi:MAG: alkaline phosphatase family protein [Solirubrobacteraceae bacterium]
MRPLRTVAAALLVCVGLVGCGSAASPGAPLHLPRSPAQLTRSKQSRFVLIVLENRELGEAIGQRAAPYLDSLAARGALALDYHAIRHPSLPNYISLLAGNPLGIESDCTECQAHGTTLVDQLEAAHVSWGAYMEDMPHPCFAGASSGGYAKKHNPFMYFPQIATDPTRCRKVVPFGALAGDLRGRRLPRFVWITPNLCDDGHDCPISSVNRFLARLTPYLLRTLGPHGVLTLVWDEGSGESGCCGGVDGGRVALVLTGPSVRPACRLSTPADHYSLLALIEDSFGLARLRGAACPCTPSLDAAFLGGMPPRI